MRALLALLTTTERPTALRMEPPHRWTPQLVEELLFRQYIKNEDVTQLLPPAPQPSTSSLAENYDKSTKMLFNYVRNGPLAALTPQNVNTATPTKLVAPAAKARVAVAAASAGATAAAARPASSYATAPTRAQTPVQKSTSRAPSPGPKNSASPATPGIKRQREWPSNVPTNRSLISTSRSKVQHLTVQRAAAQEAVDPDLIFRQNVGDLPLHDIFSSYPNALKAVRMARTASGDWRHDTFTPEEEAQYKREVGYRYLGPSQCAAPGGVADAVVIKICLFGIWDSLTSVPLEGEKTNVRSPAGVTTAAPHHTIARSFISTTPSDYLLFFSTVPVLLTGSSIDLLRWARQARHITTSGGPDLFTPLVRHAASLTRLNSTRVPLSQGFGSAALSFFPDGVCSKGTRVVRSVESDKDMCVEFFHHRGVYYTVCSRDPATVQPFHLHPAHRTAQEAAWFSHSAVQHAVRRAIQFVAPFSTVLPPAAPPQLSPTQMRQVHQLLQVVDPRLAARANVSTLVPPQKKRQRTWDGPSTRVCTPHLQGQGQSVLRTEPCRTFESGHRQARPLQAKVVHPPPNGQVPNAAMPQSAGQTEMSVPPAVRQHPPVAPPTLSVPPADIPYVRPVRSAVLRLLRTTVFENDQKFVLSPVYKFVDVLGAVEVCSESLRTNFPSPSGTREAPEGGFSPTRRVLLIPLEALRSGDYSHESGWLEPFTLEDREYKMQLKVNGSPVETPRNWSIAAAKEKLAVKSAIVADITDAVMPSSSSSDEDIFTVEVAFPTTRNVDIILWESLLVCVYVDEIPLTTIASRVATYFHPMPSLHNRRSPDQPAADPASSVDVVQGSMSVRCPLTTMNLTVPARSMHCEHLQCLELDALLHQCSRSNVWNCPLCWQPMKPTDIRVHYVLKQWIEQHKKDIDRVQLLTESEGGVLTPHYYQSHQPTSASIIELD
eukprot:gene5433-3918_t